MNQKDWIMLKTLHKENNITRTAEQLFISQPALSYRIKKIEEDLDINILMRNNRGIKFTPEGEYLVKYSLKMLNEFQNLKDHLKSFNQTNEGTIRLGVSNNYARFILPKVVKHFTGQYSKIQFTLKTGLSPEVIRMLEYDDILVGIVRGENRWYEHSIQLTTEKICIISSVPLEMDNLPNLPMISYKTDFELQSVIDKWWQQNFTAPPNVTIHLDSIETSRKLVQNGLGFAIIPSIGLNEVEENLFIYPIKNKDGSEVLRATSLIYKESSLNLPIVRTFIEFMKKFVSTL